MMLKIPLQCCFLSHVFLAGVSAGRASILDAIYESQLSALESFYNATGFDASKAIEYCDNEGVICDTEGFVLSIDLREQNLDGSIPSDIGDLVRLRALRLNDNSLFGELPTSLLAMSNLRYLNLGHNLFEGTFPDVTGLTSLRKLIFDRNAFSGTIPSSICRLSALEALDLSASTKLHGSLPSCLSNLSDLTVLRITDIGLTGSIPSDLCDGREMNGLKPNPFGCAAIGCESGHFNRGVGRQTGISDPCQPCNVPSNVIGGSICQWASHDVIDSNEDGHNGSPFLDPILPSVAPSDFPSLSPTFYPTTVPEGDQLMTRIPTAMPSLRTTMDSTDLTVEPTYLYAKSSNQPTTVQTPTSSESASSAPPTSNKIFLDASEAKAAPSTGGLVGGSATAGVCVLIFLLFILSRQGPPKYFVRADDISESSRVLVQNVREPVRRHLVAPALPILRSPERSLSTIEEEDSAIVSRSGSLETIPELPITTDPPSPPRLRETNVAKKVRFTLPSASQFYEIESKEGSEIEKLRDVEAATTMTPDSFNPFGNVDRWATWIMNPVFDAPALCASTVPMASPTSDDDRSWYSSGTASANSETPMLSQTDSNASSSEAVSMRVLGIQSRISDHGGSVASIDNSTSPPPVASPVESKRKKADASGFEMEKNRGGGTKSASSKDSRYNWRRKGMAEI
eukprot:scaffold2765_cov165-Amphora_coffeaeformis.AAC.4